MVDYGQGIEFFGICTGKLKLEHLLDYSCRLSIMREEKLGIEYEIKAMDLH